MRCGVTNLVNRATATAAELAPAEFIAGRRRLAAKVRRYRPRVIAFLGLGAYSRAFSLKQARVGPQPLAFEGAAVWVLPNPSGLNANYQLPEFVTLFRRLWQQSSKKPLKRDIASERNPWKPRSRQWFRGLAAGKRRWRP